MTQLQWLNNENGADKVCAKYHRELLKVLKRVSTSGESRVEESGGEVKQPIIWIK